MLTSILPLLAACSDHMFIQQGETPEDAPAEDTSPTIDTGFTDTAMDSGDGTVVDSAADTSADTSIDTSVDTSDTGPVDPGCGVDPFFVTRSKSAPHRLDLFLSNGDGTFARPQTIGEDRGENWIGLVVADFDGDGCDDVSARGADSDDHVLVRWDGVDWVTTDVGSLDWSPEGGGDLDGDGDFDLFGLGDTPSTAHVALGDGAGGFAELAAPFDANGPYSGYSFNLSYHAVDVSGDGVPDLVGADYTSAANDASPIWLYVGRGDGTFAAPKQITTVDTPVNGLDLADVDGDGLPDLIAGMDDDGDAAQLFLAFGTGAGFDAPFEAIDLNPGVESGTNEDGAARTQAWDWDGDGAGEVLVSLQIDPYAPTYTYYRVSGSTLSAGAVVAGITGYPSMELAVPVR